MNRTYSTPAIIVSLKPAGENNSSVTMITEEGGIVYATLYGGPKSRLKSLVAPWNSGIIYLYNNPEKKQIKISDFEVKNYHVSFGQNLFKNFAASLAAELSIKTKCAGSSEQNWKLVSGFLDGLEIANEEQGKLGLVRFLWRYLELLGIEPQTHACGECGKSFLDAAFTPDSESYYNSYENIFICPECSNISQASKNYIYPLRVSAVRYLAGISVLTPYEVRKLHIDKQDYMQLKSIVFMLIEKSVETKLNTIETGVGIL